MEYSVLMSVYYKEKPEYLKESMDSIYDQTVKTNDFVLVCDGQLTKELYEVIDEMKLKYKEVLNVIKLKENVGLGKALNEGIKHCKNEIIARMDSDDIARPYRCEKQLEKFKTNPELSIISGTVEEFENSLSNITSKRILPINHDEILEFAKMRNPFNHPCVMYKKTAVEAAGGYKHFYLLEDYYLWLRILMNGSLAYNIEEPLLYMRAGSEMFKRRSGIKYVKSQINLIRYMRKQNFISTKQEIKSILVRTIGSLIPNSLRQKIYKKKLRG